jgi:hypothetical protein
VVFLDLGKDKIMENNLVYLKVDSRNRISLTKVSKHLSNLYKARSEKGRIILEPVQEIPERERWLFAPENREVLEKVKKALREKADIDLGSFKKYAKLKA